jgi:hypothetical protein
MLNNSQKKAEELLARQQAYQTLFDPKSKAAAEVFKDLAKFCRGYRSCYHPDPRIHAALEGRREVFLRILAHTKLDPNKFLKNYGLVKEGEEE